MIDLLKPYIPEFIAALMAGVGGWFLKTKAQKKKDNADVLDKVQTIYDRMVEDTDAKISELKTEVEELKKKQVSIDAEWRKKVKEIERKWQNKYSGVQAKYNNLLREFEEYKSQHD